ncbi:MAG: hypothetical protein HY909_13915 [Deltaproteobacteria bacterium]|nr:hypothetical protein [Deltaproteobacteria bacterium]
MLPLFAFVAALELVEEWSLVPATPLREHVTARAVYPRRPGALALLPRAVQGAARPVVFAFGHRDPLTPVHTPEGWAVALPEGPSPRVRLSAQTDRATALPRLFRARWPALPASALPVRRVALVPRSLLDPSPHGWTCPLEPPEEVPCVSTARHPGPLVTRVPAQRSGLRAMLLGLVPLGLTLAVVSLPPRCRAERLLAAVGGAAVALSVALAVVGAHLAPWHRSLAALLPLGALLGALAPSHRLGRVTGAASLVVVPLLAAFGAPPALLASALAVGTLALLLGAVTEYVNTPREQ